jgi:hypothetical protein
MRPDVMVLALAAAVGASAPIGVHLHNVKRTGGMDRKTVMGLMRSCSDKESLAQSLIESSHSAETSACLNKTGIEHCHDCAMPAIKLLLNELHKVKEVVWEEHQMQATRAESTCTSAPPMSRFGSFDHCCSGSAPDQHDQLFRTPEGYQQCQAGSSFDDPGGIVRAADLDYTKLEGWKYRGDRHPSTMIPTCCIQSSVCSKNYKTLSAQMTEVVEVLDTHSITYQAAGGRLEGGALESRIESARQSDSALHLEKFCVMSPELEAAVPKVYPATTAEAKIMCTGGSAVDSQVGLFLKTQEARQTQAKTAIAGQQKIIEIINRVIKWLNDMCHSAVARAARAAASPDITPMITLLETTRKQVPRSQGEVLSRVTYLLESAHNDNQTHEINHTLCASAGSALSSVTDLLLQVKDNVDTGLTKLQNYVPKLTERRTRRSNCWSIRSTPKQRSKQLLPRGWECWLRKLRLIWRSRPVSCSLSLKNGPAGHCCTTPANRTRRLVLLSWFTSTQKTSSTPRSY